MGIKGLWGYFDKCSPVKFRNVSGADLRELVVDGYSLMYHLHEHYRFAARFGGQYPQMRQGFEEFFGILKRNGIRVVVIFDGVDYNEEKQDTHDYRRKQTIEAILSVLNRERREPGRSVIPLMATEVFFAVLRSKEIEFTVVDGDADRKIAQIANFKQCPVLGSDSDYYIYQLNSGYLPLERFEWRGGAISGELYHYQDFLQAASLKSADLLLGIPLLLGNDFYTAGIKRSLPIAFGSARKSVRVEDVVDYLIRFSSLKECIWDLETKLSSKDRGGIQHMNSNLGLLEEVYDASPVFKSDPLTEMDLVADMKQKDGRLVPKELVYMFRSGFVGLSVLEALCKNTVDLQVCMEDLKQSPCQDAGLHIRLTIYALLYYHADEATVSELIRCCPNYLDFKHNPHIFRPREIVSNVPPTCRNYVDICNLSIELRRNVLLSCLGASEAYPERLAKLPENFHLLVLLSHFWSRQCCPSKLQVESLLKCCLLLQSGITSDTIRSDKRFRKDVHPEPRVIHIFAQWQVIFKQACTLNHILSEPFTPIDIAQHYDGSLLHTVLYYSNDHRFAEKFGINRRLYTDLLETIASCCDDDKSMASTKSQDKVPAKEGLGKKRKPAKETISLDIGVTNRFAMLDLSDSDNSASSEDDS